VDGTHRALDRRRQALERTPVPIFHAIILGIVQGLSEFLPISSSGHLILVPWVLEWDDLSDPGVKKAFDVALHLGTLVAVAAYFRRDVVTYVREGTAVIVRRRVPPTPEGRLALLLLLSTVPAAVVGALFEDWIDTSLGTPTIIAVSLIVFGLVLWWADRRSGARRVEQYRLRDAVAVGSAQALALNPGTSRSGITMSAAMFLGFDRDAAARLSFLMSLPVIAGAVVFKLGGLVAEGIPEGLLAPMIAGIIASGLSGWLAVWGTLRLLRTRSFAPFVVYRIVVGVLVLLTVAVR
jgi:undecaprenyl-diphosphatase